MPSRGLRASQQDRSTATLRICVSSQATLGHQSAEDCEKPSSTSNISTAHCPLSASCSITECGLQSIVSAAHGRRSLCTISNEVSLPVSQELSHTLAGVTFQRLFSGQVQCVRRRSEPSLPGARDSTIESVPRKNQVRSRDIICVVC